MVVLVMLLLWYAFRHESRGTIYVLCMTFGPNDPLWAQQVWVDTRLVWQVCITRSNALPELKLHNRVVADVPHGCGALPPLCTNWEVE